MMTMIQLAAWYPGDEVVVFLLTIAIATAAISGVSLLIALLLSRRPALHHGVLLAGLICIGVTPVFTSLSGHTRYSLVQFNVPLPSVAREKLPRADGPQIARPIITKNEHDFTEPAISETNLATARKTETPLQQSVTIRTDSVHEQRQNRMSVERPIWFCVVSAALCLIWGLGSVLLTRRFVLGSGQIAKMRQAMQPLTPGLRPDVAERVARVVQLRRLPPIGVSRDVKTPIVTGLFLPQIVLPHSLVDTLSDAELQEIVIHESAHVARRDLWVIQVEALITILMWPIPGVRRVLRELSRSREELCDLYVLKLHERRDYGQTLLRVARIAGRNRSMALVTGIFHGPGRLESRVASLLNNHRDESTKLSSLWTVGILAGFLLLTGAVCGTRLMAGNGTEKGDDTQPVSKRIEADPQTETGPDPFGGSADEETPEAGVKQSMFIPTAGLEEKTTWTEFKPVPDSKIIGLEQMTADLTIGGAVPVGQNNQGKPIFELVLVAGSTSSQNVMLCDAADKSIYELLYRDAAAEWQFANTLWQFTYTAAPIADDNPTKSPVATPIARVLITRQPSEAADQSPVNPTARIRDSVTEYSKNIRLTSAPIIAAMIAEQGYGLAERQSLTRVAPPFSQTRTRYELVILPSWRNFYRTAPGWTDSMILEWGKNTFQWKSTCTSILSLKLLPKFFFNWNEQYLEGDKSLLDQSVAGDWVVRKGSSAAEILADLERILDEQLSLRVHFEFRQVLREVYVAQGEFKHQTLPNRDATIVSDLLRNNDGASLAGQLFVFPREQVPREGAYFANGSLDELLLDAGNWISTPILNEVETPPDGQLCWHRGLIDRAARRNLNQFHEPTDEEILNQLSQQTGLHFIKKRRPIKVLFVEEAKLQ